MNEFRLEREAYVGDTAITKKQANFTISNLHEIDPHNSILMPQHWIHESPAGSRGGVEFVRNEGTMVDPLGPAMAVV